MFKPVGTPSHQLVRLRLRGRWPQETPSRTSPGAGRNRQQKNDRDAITRGEAVTVRIGHSIECIRRARQKRGDQGKSCPKSPNSLHSLPLVNPRGESGGRRSGAPDRRVRTRSLAEANDASDLAQGASPFTPARPDPLVGPALFHDRRPRQSPHPAQARAPHSRTPHRGRLPERPRHQCPGLSSVLSCAPCQ